MKSQIWYLPAGFVALCGEGSEKEEWLLPALLSRRKLSPSSCPDDRQFSSSLYVSGAFQSAAPMPESPAISVFLSLNPCCFLQPEVMATSFPGTGTLGWGSLGPFTPKISLPIFMHYTWVWDQPVPCLLPSYQSQCSFFFNSVIV